jgi:selenocysteine-specific elongation factor
LTDDIASVTLGTAGHIDHGKSALIHRLTGIDPDRLKEEQLRGMTIDLGYAFYTTRKGMRVGVIDVPGHEKFVKNMVTGASAIDIVILAVAADDGVMPQTREHLEIMEVMGIRQGIVALTKIDLVDPEMVELAAQDVEDLITGTFLDGEPVHPLSSETGEGFEPFIDRLEALIDDVERTTPSGLFRLPVQRVFSAKGFGTVVTGVPVSGTIRIGDPVEVLPQGLKGKIRGLQAFGKACEEGRPGHRVALNIADVDYHDLQRGCSVTQPGCFKPVHHFEGRFTFFDSMSFPLKNMTEVKVHAGTDEVLARIVLLDRKVLEPGETGFVQLRPQQPMVLAPGDPFLIRRHSPALTMGGGTVVDISDRKARRFKAPLLDRLEARHEALGKAPEDRLEFEMRHWPGGLFTVEGMSRVMGQEKARVQALLDKSIAEGAITRVGRDRYIHKACYAGITEGIEEALKDLHARFPLKSFLDMTLLRNRISMEVADLQHLVKIMEEDGRLEAIKGGMIRLSGFQVELNGDQERLVEAIMEILDAKGLSPPTQAELAARTGVEVEDVASMITFLVEEGRVMNIGGFHFSVEVIDRLKEAVVEFGRETGEVKIPKIKEVFPTTRKYIIPVMEYLDSINLTRREGEKRFLR